jgi:hypothetical protein
MKHYVLFSDDVDTRATFRTLFQGSTLQIRSMAEFPLAAAGASLVVIDGDGQTVTAMETGMRWLQRKKIPLVFLTSCLGGREAMRLMRSRVVSILFKDEPAPAIRHEIRKIMLHKHYLDNIGAVARNEKKTRTFLNVMKSVTSDKNIDEIMTQILMTMKDTFQLQTISLFLQTDSRIKAKMVFGDPLQHDADLQWQTSKLPLWMHTLINQHKPLWVKASSGADCPFPPHSVLLPVVIKEKFLGFLCAIFPTASQARTIQKEIDLLHAFTEQAAVAIENARLYWDVIQAREELVTKEKNALLGQMIISLNHEINNPLSIISLEAQILQKTIQHKESKADVRLAKIETNIERIKSILEKISSLTVEDYAAVEYFSGKEMANLQ